MDAGTSEKRTSQAHSEAGHKEFLSPVYLFPPSSLPPSSMRQKQARASCFWLLTAQELVCVCWGRMWGEKAHWIKEKY